MIKRVKKKAYVRCRGGSISCTFGCIGCGLCVAACHLAAIRLENGAPPVIDRSKCVGCGLCANACPQHLIEVILPDRNIQVKCSNCDAGKAAREACANSCIACGLCERNCPADAIHVIDSIAVIDPGKCICCGMCAVKCPRGVIRDSNGVMTAD